MSHTGEGTSNINRPGFGRKKHSQTQPAKSVLSAIPGYMHGALPDRLRQTVAAIWL